MKPSSAHNPAINNPRAHIAYLPWRRIFGGLLAIWLIVVLVSSLRKSPVVDEVPHIGAGLTYWAYGDFRMNPEHPPLIKMLAVLPAMLLDHVPVKFETGDFYVRSWFYSQADDFGYFLLFRNQVNPKSVVFHARIIPALIGLIGGVLAFWWGRRLGRGTLAGAASGLLLLLYPEFAGHARFVTLDVPTLVGCAGISAASYAWWRTPDLKHAVLFAVLAMVGSLIKLPVSVFAALTLFTLLVLSLAGRRRIRIGHYVVLFLLTIGAGYLGAWASSGFRFQLTNPALEITQRSLYAPADGNYGTGALSQVLNFAWKHRLLPETTLATITHVQSFDMRNLYFMGQWARHGWYSYFFVTFFMKTSLVMLGVYVAATITWITQLLRMKGDRRRFELGRLVLFLLPFVLLFLVFVLGRASLGHRYILFIYFPLSVLAGTAMVRWWMRTRAGQFLAVAILAFNIIIFARQYPHYETYFNEIIRTPYRALPYLADSNVDWGQDFQLLGDEIRKMGARDVNLALFGSSRPSAYGINQYRWILPDYPFALFQRSEKSVSVDLSLPTAMSLNGLMAARSVYRGHFTGEPLWSENSIVIYAPEISLPPQ